MATPENTGLAYGLRDSPVSRPVGDVRLKMKPSDVSDGFNVRPRSLRRATSLLIVRKCRLGQRQLFPVQAHARAVAASFELRVPSSIAFTSLIDLRAVIILPVTFFPFWLSTTIRPSIQHPAWGSSLATASPEKGLRALRCTSLAARAGSHPNAACMAAS